MKAEDFIHQFGIFSREGKAQPASKSEIRRWLEAGAVYANAERLSVGEEIDFPVNRLVLFPKGRTVTLA